MPTKNVMSVSNSNHKFTAIENGTNFRDWDKQSYAIAMAADCEWVIDTDYPRVPRTIRNHAGEPFTEPMVNLMSFQEKDYAIRRAGFRALRAQLLLGNGDM